jgi:hypothetical protein
VTHPLWPRMNAALNALELASEVNAPNPNATGGGKPSSRVLSFTDRPDHLHWLAKWNAAVTDRHHEDALAGALAALDRIHGRNRAPVTLKPETDKERTARILHRNNEGASPHEVALSMWGDITPRMIENARKDEGLDPATGRAWRNVESSQAKARRMLMAGSSLRVVEAATGIPRSTLHRMRTAA